jgi:hypothetical protein
MKVLAIIIAIIIPIMLSSKENDRIIYSNSKGNTFISTNSGINWVNIWNESNRIIKFTNSINQNFYSVNNGKSWIGTVNESTKIKFSLYPNPVTDYISILIADNIESKRKLSVYSFANSKIVFEKEVSFDKNKNSLEIPLENLQKGKYLIVIETENRTSCEIFFKQ